MSIFGRRNDATDEDLTDPGVRDMRRHKPHWWAPILLSGALGAGGAIAAGWYTVGRDVSALTVHVDNVRTRVTALEESNGLPADVVRQDALGVVAADVTQARADVRELGTRVDRVEERWSEDLRGLRHEVGTTNKRIDDLIRVIVQRMPPR